MYRWTNKFYNVVMSSLAYIASSDAFANNESINNQQADDLLQKLAACSIIHNVECIADSFDDEKSRVVVFITEDEKDLITRVIGYVTAMSDYAVFDFSVHDEKQIQDYTAKLANTANDDYELTFSKLHVIYEIDKLRIKRFLSDTEHRDLSAMVSQFFDEKLAELAEHKAKSNE